MPTSPKSISRLGKYRLVRQIGQGGMGRVYLGVNDETGEQVAVKVLSSKRVRNQTYVDRFYREAEAAGVLQHPNIVGAIEVGEYEKRHYFVMEYIEGETARQRLKRKRSLDEGEALNICEKVALALSLAEQHSIVHRDIKPDNIMLTKDDVVKLTDMGLAKNVEDASATLTQAGTMIGTPLYMSPEQLRGDPNIDGRADIYSLGMTLYHLLVGRPAFDGETVAHITIQHMNNPVPSVCEERPELSEGSDQLIQKMTRKDPADRYQTAGDLLMDIHRVQQGETIGGKKKVDLGHRHRHTLDAKKRKETLPLVPLTVVGSVLLIIIAALFSSFNKSEVNEKITSKQNTNVKEKVVEPDEDLQEVEFVETNPVEIKPTVEPPERQIDNDQTERKKLLVKFQELRSEAQQKSEGRDYEGALALLESAREEFDGPDWDGRFKNVTGGIHALADKEFKSAQLSALKAVQSGDFGTARKILTDLGDKLPADVAQKRALAIAKLESGQKEMSVDKAALDVLKPKLSEALKTRDYQAARKLVQVLGGEMKTGAFQNELADMENRIEQIEIAWTTALKQLEVMRGKPFNIMNKNGTILSVKDERLLLKVDAGEIPVPLKRELKFSQVINLAGRSEPDENTLNVHFGLVWMAFYEGLFEANLSDFKTRDQSPEYQELLHTIDVAIREGKGEEADLAWENILKQAKESEWKALSSGLAGFKKKFDGTSHFEKRQDIHALFVDAAGEALLTNRVASFRLGNRSFISPIALKVKSSSLTMELWFKTEKRSGTMIEIGGDAQGCALLIDHQGFPCLAVRSSSSAMVIIRGPMPADDGRFHHVCGVMNAETQQAALYVDGEFVQEKRFSLMAEEPAERLSIASGSQSNISGEDLPWVFIGEMDEVKIWNIARTATDVREQSWRRPKEKEHLAAYWNFDRSGKELTRKVDLEFKKAKDAFELNTSSWYNYLPVEVTQKDWKKELLESREKLAAQLKELLRGQFKIKDDLTVELTYDFRNPEESRDWEQAGRAAFSMRDGRLNRIYGESYVAVFNKARFIGGMSFEVATGPGSESGILFRNSGFGDEGRYEGLGLHLSSSRDYGIWLGRYGDRRPIHKSAFSFQRNQRNSFRLEHKDFMFDLRVNGLPVFERRHESFIRPQHNRFGLRYGDSWESVKVTGRIDPNWLKERKDQLPAANYAIETIPNRRNRGVYVPALGGVSSGPFTWEGWFNLRKQESTTLFQTVRRGGNRGVSLRLGINKGGKLQFSAERDGKTQDVYGQATMPWDRWLHIAVSNDLERLRLFVNGKPYQTVQWPSSLNPADYPLQIGGSGVAMMHGLIDEVRLSRAAVYSRTFSPERALKKEKDTLLLLHMDEGEGKRLYDSASGVISVHTGSCRRVVPESGMEVSESLLWDAHEKKDPSVRMSLSFDGNGDYVEIPYQQNLNVSSYLTAEAWVRIERFRQGGAILSKQGQGNVSYLLMTGRDNAMYFLVSTQDDYKYIKSPNLVAGRVYHVAATFNRGDAALFIDGKEVGRQQWPWRSLPVTKGNPLRIGMHSSRGEQEFFEGQILSVRLWNRIRYSKEFEPEREFKRTRGAILLLSMQRGKGSVVYDAVSRKARGKITYARWKPVRWK